jgi:hypothetical protein
VSKLRWLALAVAAAGCGGKGAAPSPPALVYTDPPPGSGVVRLAANPQASSGGTLQLDLVLAVGAPPSYAAGLNLPVGDRVRLASPAFLRGVVLDPGAPPVVAGAAIAGSLLLSGVSQKAAGAGAVAGDVPLPAGAVLYSLRLEMIPGAARGLIFDGGVPADGYRAAVRERAGNDTVDRAAFAIGRLEIR